MLRKTAFIALTIAVCVFMIGCGKANKNQNANGDVNNIQNQATVGNQITDRTDYVIFYQKSEPSVLGGAATSTYIVGRPEAEAGSISFNAYFVPWKIYFSQVQHTGMAVYAGACENITEQEVLIEGWIDLNLAEINGAGPNTLPNPGPAFPSGTVHETVTGTPGTWRCGSEVINTSVNQGSVEYIQSVTGTHEANFSDASNMTDMTVAGADLYLDLSMSGDVKFIWPAGTKIEYAPEGMPIPLEPLAPSQL